MKSGTTEKYLESLLQKAAEQVYKAIPEHLEVSAVFDVIHPKEEFGDYATNFPLVVAKQLKMKPQDLGQKIIAELQKLDKQKVFEQIYFAAGFINFKLSSQFLLANLGKIISHGDLYGASMSGEGKTVVVEYFQNNVAKPPHVGHLRSAVIGDSLLRIMKAQGYKAISDTHIGDWGVQFGILIYAYKEFIKNGGDKDQIAKNPIDELNKLYVEMSAKIEADESLRDKGKEEFIKLEKGNTENRELWQWFVRVSLEDFEKYRKLLDVLPFDHNLGESFYEEHMPAVLEELKSKNLVLVGETGEQYVDLEQYGLGRCILVKSDGGTTYHMRDFATYKYRKEQFKFFKNIYVVDNRQSHHFKQLFKVFELAGYPAESDSIHVDLGFMSLPEGAISTRKGTTISLKNLIEEAQKRALAIIEEKNPDLKNKLAIANLVALGAIKYFDLSHNRKTEIVFTWENALSFEGNTGPYLQYTHARIQGILRKSRKIAETDTEQRGNSVPRHSALSSASFSESELSVLRKLQKFPEIIEQVAKDFLPNLLANYLFELAQLFNSFYQEVPVLQETDKAKKSFRLQLITATAQVIRNGLYLLGIEAPEEM